MIWMIRVLAQKINNNRSKVGISNIKGISESEFVNDGV